MEKIGQLFNLGFWTVKPEHASDFIAAWAESAEWLEKNLPEERGAVLLSDNDVPGKFISFAPVSNPQKVIEIMARAEFQEKWAKVVRLCDEVKPNRMFVAASAGEQ